MKKLPLFFVLFLIICSFFTVILKAQTQNKNKPTIKITFINKLNNQPVTLDSILYTNCWKENFTINKLKYYISNISLQTADKKINKEKNSYHLINEENAGSKSLELSIAPDKYETISFLIGVDSLKNVSGAQTDALDPLRGLFWTWNSGYIMFKLEGTSSQSTMVNNKMEYHIGGFAGVNNVLRTVKLNFKESPIILTKQKITEIIIHVDIDKIWSAPNKITIAQTPVCTIPGALAASIADNYVKAFKIDRVINH